MSMADSAKNTGGRAGAPLRVCVFPCGSEIGLEIHRALAHTPHVALLGASSAPSNHGPFAFREYVDGLPYVTDPRFLAGFNALARERGIDVVYPAHDDAVLFFAREREALACGVVGSAPETCVITRSKRATYEHLRGRVATPRVFATEGEDPPFPVFLKPERGHSARGVYLVNSRAELAVFLGRDPSLMAMEYLPGAEYTIDCFTDRHGRLRFLGARERVRVSNGISVHARTVDGTPFRETAEAIHGAFDFRGAWFFQMKARANGKLVLLEVSPRVSGGMALYRALGVNFPLLSVYDWMGRDVDIVPIEAEAEMDRALANRFNLGIHYERVYMDLDDTVLDTDTVRPLALLFLHQCRTRGVPVHLVTRHAADPAETLRRHGLEPFFTAVHHVAQDECKCACMSGGPAIFIDDSHAERKRVREALGIPGFGVDALEALIDWRM